MSSTNRGAVVCVPTIMAKGMIFRLLNSLDLDVPIRLSIDRHQHNCVARKWNTAIDLAVQLQVPIITLNDDIVPWPGALSSLLDAVEGGALCTGITTCNYPRPGKSPEELTRGGFSMWAARYEFFNEMALLEEGRWGNVSGRFGHRPGRFDEGFEPAYSEDTDFYRRMGLVGMRDEVVEEAWFYHEITQSAGNSMVGCTSNMSDPDRWRRHRSILLRNEGRYCEKWGGPVGSEIYDTPWGGGESDEG